MNPLLNQLISNFMMGKLSGSPQMSMFNQMMRGKSPEQQMQTILNMAKSKGIDIDQKMFSEADLKGLGLSFPRKG